ncbi:type I-F CRISPR-associated protein Csy3 [Endozoicomonas sp. (ex Bugula neritina AB1)]|nr:type I-F CRISPR-associated protein Csy3 [Endozoicomonas sp. (ex Bugula neritina AB1)]
MAKNEIASVLAFEKKIVPSDGRMYGTDWEKRLTTIPQPLALQEKSVRGTISNRLKAAVRNDPAKLNAEVEKPNLQKVDSCTLAQEHDTLQLNFTIKFLGGLQQPSACNNVVFKNSYQKAVAGYIKRTGCKELARRYALNIANGRFLWRNRVGTESIEIHVNELNKGAEQTWTFDATQFSTRHFDVDDNNVNTLATRIAETLASEDDFLLLDITAYAKVGRAQEVYPSEELVLDKGKSEKSKILYDISDVAAMHSQKLGNAIRTIDTWYPGYDDPEHSAGPIAAEPYGAVTNLGKAFRTPKEKQDFYSFFDKWACGATVDRLEDEHYIASILIRGGVFGQSDK